MLNDAPEKPTVEANEAYAFTAHDRCDRCRAQAYFRIVTMSGDLLFCGHHRHAYRDTIEKVAISVEGSIEHLRAPLDVSA